MLFCDGLAEELITTLTRIEGLQVAARTSSFQLKSKAYDIFDNGFLRPNDVFPKAKAAAKRALELDAALPEVHTSLGYISSFYDMNWEAAEREFKQAIERNPNDALSRLWYALNLLAVGRFEEGLKEAQQGQELDPISPIINSLLGISYIWNRTYDEAVEQLNRTVEIDPNFLLAQIWLSNAYGMSAEYKKAVEELDKVLAVEIDMPYALGHLGWTYGMFGKEKDALKMLNRLERISEKRYVSPWSIAFIYLGLGDIERAFEYLEKSYSEREPIFAMTIRGPWYDILRPDPRYAALLKKMGGVK